MNVWKGNSQPVEAKMQQGRRVVRASEIGRSKLPLGVFARAQRCLAPFLLMMRAHCLRTCHSALVRLPNPLSAKA